ncbi:MFS transporter [Dyella halodurans]|uniref:MFS transporter n=1 Tax=Dyella halodurans TaxID=1920171 RepID=A0ABV9C1E7_9GAMM|nr:MFS transporter [Dyella halodurans]
MFVQIGVLIIATSLVQLAIGFFNTFLSLRLTAEHFGPGLNGLILSAYFAGFTVGAMLSGRLIRRIGHIRSYAAFAGMVVVATAVIPLLVQPFVWIVCRLIVGVGCVGLFITTECWLNAKARPEQRGRVFSIYMFGTLVAFAIGQLLIGVVVMASAAPFFIIMGLFSFALVIMSTTRAEAPALASERTLGLGELSQRAPTAVIGCVVGGLVNSAFYALVPAWMLDQGTDQSTIAMFMFVAVLGGLAFQIPVGRLSDRGDRRIVLIGLALGFAVVALVLVALPHSLVMVLPAAALLGGFMSTLYPVCVAYALDHMTADRMVAVSGKLILVNGIGAALGPLIGSSVMGRMGINGLLYFMAMAAVVLAAVVARRIRLRAPPAQVARTFGILDPMTAPILQEPDESPRESAAA